MSQATVVAIPDNPRFQDLTGQRFGRLVIDGYAGVRGAGRGQTIWLCRCDCGSTTSVAAGHLRCGHTRSCGCLRTGPPASKTHGKRRTPEYGTWSKMVQRCINPRDRAFVYYGGRGIGVCDRWRQSFEAFLADVGPRPSPNHSIDRINNDGHYEPSNVRWATDLEQGRNTRRKRVVTFKGREMCLAEAIILSGISQSTVEGRLRKGWPEKDALTTPPVRGKRPTCRMIVARPRSSSIEPVEKRLRPVAGRRWWR